jgi:hypothetical protein
MHGDDLQVHGSVFRSNHAQKKPRRGGTKPVARGIPPYYRLRGSWRNGRLALRMLPLPHHPAVDQHDSGRPRARPVPGRSPIKATPRDPQPATPMKAGLGKSFIATGRLIAPPQAPARWARSADLTRTRGPGHQRPILGAGSIGRANGLGRHRRQRRYRRPCWWSSSYRPRIVLAVIRLARLYAARVRLHA